jgi:hypothetical protein
MKEHVPIMRPLNRSGYYIEWFLHPLESEETPPFLIQDVEEQYVVLLHVEVIKQQEVLRPADIDISEGGEAGMVRRVSQRWRNPRHFRIMFLL